MTDTAPASRFAAFPEPDLTQVPEPARPVIFDCRDVIGPLRAKLAVRDITLELRENEITALIGPSGCGKCTFIRCLNRMNDLIPGARVEGQVALPRRRSVRSGCRSGAGAQAHRDGVPEAEPVPEVDLRQHRVRAPGGRDGRRPRRDRRVGAQARRALGRGQGPPEDQRLRHVRRPAAAALHRARAGHAARRAADGRAVLGAGPDLDRQDRGPDGPSSRATTRS